MDIEPTSAGWVHKKWLADRTGAEMKPPSGPSLLAHYQFFVSEPGLNLGEPTFLVFGICECRNFWCAMPEFAIWPECPKCDRQVAPAVLLEGERLGFVARFEREQDAYREVRGPRKRSWWRRIWGWL